MGKAVEQVWYEVVREDGGWTVVRRGDGRTAEVITGWLTVKDGMARAVSQTKQLRIDGLEWKEEVV